MPLNEHITVSELIAVLQEMPGDEMVHVATYRASGGVDEFYVIKDIEAATWDIQDAESEACDGGLAGVWFTIEKRE